jgi:hypothetical protein
MCYFCGRIPLTIEIRISFSGLPCRYAQARVLDVVSKLKVYVKFICEGSDEAKMRLNFSVAVKEFSMIFGSVPAYLISENFSFFYRLFCFY